MSSDGGNSLSKGGTIPNEVPLLLSEKPARITAAQFHPLWFLPAAGRTFSNIIPSINQGLLISKCVTGTNREWPADVLKARGLQAKALNDCYLFLLPFSIRHLPNYPQLLTHPRRTNNGWRSQALWEECQVTKAVQLKWAQLYRDYNYYHLVRSV